MFYMTHFINRVLFPCLFCFIVSAPIAKSQEQRTTISEPAPVKIEELLKQADLAAIVRVISGDTEHYSQAVYKAEVLQPFKGLEKGATFYFGPFIGFGLGEELLVFLHHSETGIEPKHEATSSGFSYGPVSSFYLVMYDGYSALPVKYDCVFTGKEIRQQCDYGVRVNTFHVVLPNSLKTYPSSTRGSFSEDRKWVRKATLVAYLRKLSQ
ncbi:MAG: hypothetical protein JWO71_3665 [Candidatus Acidoferrum typicum]|nr:hypothetical protein [Candidatus Acidoferrum typicum]